MSSLLTRPDYARVNTEVTRILRQFEVKSPPVNVLNIARELGLAVHFVRFSGKFNRVSGFYDATEHAIYVNAEEYPLRQTFTIAHELGHSLMHRDWAQSTEYKLLMRDPDAHEVNPYEKEANVFAANLLVPRHILDQYVKDRTEQELSRLFAVSVPMIRNRIAFEYGY
jgi:Zn-dependent peptidase ImmA (M78 family)